MSATTVLACIIVGLIILFAILLCVEHDKLDYEKYKNSQLERAKGSLEVILNDIRDYQEKLDEIKNTQSQIVDRVFEETSRKIAEIQDSTSSKKKEEEKKLDEFIERAEEKKLELQNKITEWESTYNGLVNSYLELEKENEKRHSKCISLPKEDMQDIEYLVSTVSALVNNREVVPKMVWSGYVQKPLSALLKNEDIREEPGIYKITNINNNKCYIGQSTNVKKRIQDHFKAVCGIRELNDQPLHHRMFQQGLENFQVEVICYCDKSELDEREAFYIKEFKSQEYGYNILPGNGGGETIWKTT